tara:strand:- start:761 stop:1279 length:519 start_codon:yes stop_codon:yes gene_type:complete
MKLDEKMMKKVLKEEYSNRVNYFLNEKIAITDKRGVNVLEYAKGLKVLDSVGNQYTFDTIVKKQTQEFAKLYLPEEPREDAYGSQSTQSLKEEDRGEIGFYSRGSGPDRDISPVEDNDSYLFGEEEPLDRPENEEESLVNEPDVSPKLPDRKYILVPMGEFEERFRLKIEEE